MPSPWPGPGQDQGHHVADPLRGRLPSQPPNRPPGPEAAEHPGVEGGERQAGRLRARPHL